MRFFSAPSGFVSSVANHTSVLLTAARTQALVSQGTANHWPVKAGLLKTAVALWALHAVAGFAAVTVSPAALNWVSVPVGGKGAQKAITLTNGNTTAITISSITLTGADLGDFEIFSRTCGTSLAASASCTASIVFAPTTTGSRTATLDFNDSATGSPQTVALSGTGTAASGSVTASPASLTFASRAVGSASSAQSATLSNGLTTPVTISSVAISGTNAADFTISTKTCGTSLAAATNCTASVVFKPTAAGTRTARLSFTDSATNSPQSVALTGTGAATGGSASVSPSSINWVSVAVGKGGAPKAATLTNNGTTAIAISGITLTGANPGDYQISSKTCGTSLAGSASCTATIVFAPTATGVRTATLNFSDGANNSPQTVALSGDGTGASGSVTASPATLSFASTAVGVASASQAGTLSNGLTTSITISGIAISGTNAGDFSIASKTCGTSLAASTSCTAAVVFKPTAAGTRTATLNFTDSGAGSPQFIALSGTGAGAFTIAPLNPTVAVNGTLQFTATYAATWTTTCGTIGSSTGLYTAPATAASCMVTGTASTGTASTTVTVSASVGQVQITPSLIALHAIGQTQFTANQSVIWSTSCGTINSSGLFTAPATETNCTITAIASGNTSNKSTAVALITVVNYTVRKNGGNGNGVQADEVLLTPSSVSSGKFGQKWSAAVDGGIWGQPLYMNAVTINGKVRNAVFVTTSNDSVYAFDADTGSLLWKKSFLSTGVTAVAGASVKISNTTGILSTPVIDQSTGILYVVAETSENSATYFPHRLHALTITTGQEALGGPVLITHPDLEPVYKFQRPGLLLANGYVYVGFGSIEDHDPYHGLLFAFDAKTLSQAAVFNATPTGGEGGLWMSGSAPTADSDGNIYVSTGNGTVSSNNYGESIVKLSPTLQELDFFTPYNYVDLNKGDYDLGSGAVLVVPDQSGPIAHELIVCGKPTPIYVLNRDNLGGRGTTSDNIVQRLDHQLGNSGNFRDSGQPCYNSPAMWKQNVYFAPNHDVLKMFVLDPSTGMLSATPVAKGTYTYLWPGSDPEVSSNGDGNGIVWTLDAATATLHANDAADVSKVLYTSPSLGSSIRWVPPTVANGHVYLGLSGKVVAYGLQ